MSDPALPPHTSTANASPRMPLQRIAARRGELGDGLVIQRALPTRDRRMVGAWCFLDHIGPTAFAPGEGLHVGAHPHIGLQTFTWMIEGEILHRDSLGSEQVIRPGQVNLMTAGHGIVHTEDSVAGDRRVHAAQLWIALPAGEEDREPAFEHHPQMPTWQAQGCDFTLLAGTHAGRTAPTRVYSPLLGLELHATAETEVTLALQAGFEHGVLVLEGRAMIDDEPFEADEFAYLAPGPAQLRLALPGPTRLLVLGGEPFEPPIQMWWNFVGSTRERIAHAQREWETGGARFGRVTGDEGRRLVAPALPWPGL